MAAPATATRAFTQRFATNANGSIAVIGNANMSCANSAACTTVRNGTTTNNNGVAMTWVNIDPTQTNSSSATLTLPAGATVLFAGLYWGGDTNNAAAGRNVVSFRPPGASAYTSLTASQFDTSAAGATGDRYQGFADVTAAVTAAGSGTYTVANIQAANNQADVYAGWSLYVAYSSPTDTMRNLVVFDGLVGVAAATPQTISVSGFLTPLTGTVASTLSVSSYEGDVATSGDKLVLNTTELRNNANALNNYFNSSITTSGARNPSYLNNLGIDIDTSDVSGIIPNGATSATINLSSTGDVYLPGVVALATQIYSPEIKPTFAKTVTDVNGGAANPGDVLQYEIPVNNTGKDFADNTVLTDVVPAGTSFVPGSLQVVGGANTGPKTDQAGDDQAEISGASMTFRLGTGATATAGGTLAPGAGSVIRFRVRIDAGTLDGTVIRNTAQASFVGRVLGTVLTAVSNEAQTPVVAPPAIAATKRDGLVADVNGDGVVNPGDTLEYTTVVTNSGIGTATGVRFVDSPGNYLNVVAGSVTTDRGTVTSGAPPIVVEIGDLAVGQTATVRFRATVASPLPEGSLSVTNQGTVSGTNFASEPTDDPDTAAAADPTATAVIAPPALSLNKLVSDDNGGATAPGDTLTYTLLATNDGSGPATGVAITDIPTAPLAVVAGSATLTLNPAGAGSVSIAGNTVTASGITLPAGGTATVSFRVTIPNPVPAGLTQVANQATLTATGLPTLQSNDPLTAAPADPTVLALAAAPAMRLSKSDALAPGGDLDADGVPSPGDRLRYTLVVTNAGNQTAAGVSVTDAIGANLQLVAGSVTTSAGSVTTGNGPTDTSVNVAAGSVAPGTPVTVTFDVLIANPLPAGVTTVVNQAQLSGTGVPVTASDDPGTAAAGDATVTAITAAPRVAVSKAVVDLNGGAAAPGDVLEYTVTIVNSGNTATTGVAVNDVIDPNLIPTGAPAVAPAGTASFSGSNLTASIATIAGGGGQATVTFRTTIRSPLAAGVTGVSNQAQVTGSGITQTASDDPATGAAGDPTVTSLVAAPAMALTKTAAVLVDADGNGVASPGDTLVYTLQVSNGGNQAGVGAIATDLLDANLSLVAGSVQTTLGTVTTGNAPGDRAVAVNVGSVAGAGGTATITFQARIASPLPAGVTQVANQATLAGTNFTAVPSDDPSTPQAADATVTNLTAAPKVAVTKAVALLTDVTGDGPSPGDTLGYTITIVNSGNIAATGTGLVDNIDPNLAPVAGSATASAGTATLAGQLLTVSGIGTVPGGGGTVTISFRATVRTLPAGVSAVDNQAGVSGTNFPAVQSDDPATATAGDATRTVVTAKPVLTASKTAVLAADADGSGTPSPGDTLRYTITVTNTGNQAATAVTLDDAIDPNLVPVTGSASASTGTATLSGQSLTGSFGTIPAGGEVTVTVLARIAAPLPAGVTQVSNQATVGAANTTSAASDDPAVPGGADPTVTAITAAPKVGATKRATLGIDADGDGVASPGDTLVYTVVVANTGNQTAAGVSVTDTIGANLTLVPGSLATDRGSVTSGSTGGSAVAVSVGLLPGGEQATITFSARIASPVPAGVTQVANQGTVSGSNFADTRTDDPATTTGGDATVTPVTAAPRLAVTKTDVVVVDTGTAGASPGDTLLYTITITNTGNGAATGVSLADIVDANLTLVPGSLAVDTGTVTDPTGPDIATNIGTLPGGGTAATVTFRATIASPLPAGVTQIANQATVGGTNVPTTRSDDPATAAGGDATITPVTAAPKLGVTKTAALAVDADGNGVPSPGDTLTYAIVTANTGNQAATGVTVTDPIGPNTTLVTGSAQTSLGTITTGNGTGDTSLAADLGTLPGGASATTTFRVTVANPLPAGVTEVANQATATATGIPAVASDDPSTAAGGDPTRTALTAAPKLAATKRDALVSDPGGDGPSPGDRITYTVVVANSGNQAAASVSFADVIGPNVTLVAGSVQTDRGTVSDGTGPEIAVALGTIPGGEQATVTFSVTVDAPLPVGVTQVANQGTVSAAGQPDLRTDDPDTATTGDATRTAVTATPRLTVTKTDALAGDPDANGIASPGDTLRYMITVTSTGNTAATDVTLADTIDPNLAPVAGSAIASTGTPTLTAGTGGFGGSLSLTGVSALPVGEAVTVTFLATIRTPLPAGVTQVANQATAGAAGVAQVSSDDPATAASGDATVTPLTAAAALSATKTDALATDADGNGVPSPGDTLLYSIAVTNTGNTAATGVTLADVIDPNLAVIAATVQAGQGTATATPGAGGFGGNLTGALGTIPGGGASTTVTFRATIRSPIPAGVTQVSNRATITADGIPATLTDDPELPGTSDATLTPITANPAITVTKAAALEADADGNGTPSPGDTLRFTIRVVNNGNTTATGVTLADVIDPNLALVAGSGTPGGIATLTPGAGGFGGSVSAALGAIPGGGAESVITYRATVRDPVSAGTTTVANQATVSGANFTTTVSDDPATAAAGDPTLVPLTAAPAMGATKRVTLLTDADASGGPSPGDTLLYTVTTNNAGNIAGTGAVANDLIDPNLQLVPGSVATSQGTVTAGNTAGDTRIGVDLGTVAGRGGTATVTFQVTIRSPLAAGVTSVANQATVSGTNFPEIVTDDPATVQPNDPTVTAVTANPQIVVTKRDSLVSDPAGDGPGPGDTLLYTVVIVNSGNGEATGLTLADAISPNLAVNAASITASAGTPALAAGVGGFGGTLSVTSIGSLPGGGGTATITFTAVVRDPLPEGVTQVANQATVSGTNVSAVNSDDPDSASPGDPTVTAVTAAPSMHAVKRDTLVVDADGNGSPSPGDTLLYTITIMNTGSQAGSATITNDIVDPNTTLVAGSVQTTQGTVTAGASGGATVGVDVGSIPGRGGTATVSFRVTIANPLPADATSVGNQATVSGSNFAPIVSDDPTTDALNDATRTTVVASPVLSTTKRATLTGDVNGDGVADPGDTITYVLRVTNIGNRTASGVSLNDPIDPNLVLESGSLQASQGTITAGATGGTTVAVDVGSLAVGPTGSTVTFRATVRNPLPVGVDRVINQATVNASNAATVTSDDPGTVAADDATVVAVVATPIVTASKTVVLATDANGNGLPDPGDTVLYRVVVQNTGNTAATGLRVADPVDADTALVVGSASASPGTVVSGNGTGDTAVAVDLATLPVGETATVSFRVTVRTGLPTGVTAVTNQAQVTGTNFPATTTNTTSISVSVAAPSNRRMTATKQARLVVDADRDGRAGPGDTIQFTIVVRNTGDLPITAIAFTDALPTTVAYVAGSLAVPGGSGTFVAPNAVRARIPNLAVGASTSISFLVKPLPRTTAPTTLANQGALTADGIPAMVTSPPGGAGASTIGLVGGVRIAARKTGPARARGGSLIRYTIRVTNRGDRAATNVTIRDPLPADMSYVSSSPRGRIVRGAVVWTIPSLAKGATRTITLTVRVAKTARGVHRNRIEVLGANAPATAAVAGVRVTPTRVTPPSPTG